jgi:hypothetical protein
MTIIIGSFATLMLSEPIWALVILVIIKVVVDMRAHWKEHHGASGAIKDKTATQQHPNQ